MATATLKTVEGKSASLADILQAGDVLVDRAGDLYMVVNTPSLDADERLLVCLNEGVVFDPEDSFKDNVSYYQTQYGMRLLTQDEVVELRNN